MLYLTKIVLSKICIVSLNSALFKPCLSRVVVMIMNLIIIVVMIITVVLVVVVVVVVQ